MAKFTLMVPRVVCFLTVGFLALFIQVPLNGQLQMVWPEGRSFDFGSIVEGKPVSHVFTFQNTGSEPLRVETVRTTCGCTAADFEQKSIAPGQTGTITIHFDGQVPIGSRFKKKIQVYFVGKRKAVRLSIRGEVT
jgi:hypothetical protein